MEGAGDNTAAPRAVQVSLLPLLFVGLFGVLLASFPARKVDIWKHLAAGRDLIGGVEGPGPTWLYDLMAYVLYSVAGGAGLVAAKALTCGLIAGLLLRISQSKGGWWIPLVVTSLAVLAMGSRLLLHPATISVLFLVLSLWLLVKDEARSPGVGGVWPGWRFVVLSIVWANVDGWFVLGLGVVGLSWLGRIFDARPLGGLGQALGRWVGGVGILVAATCLSPSHVHGLALPPELRSAAVALRGDHGSGFPTVNSPFEGAYFSVFRDSAAALAYYPLLGLGALAFLLNRKGWRWTWFLPWLGLAVVSGLQVRAVPFFAVVAGPVLAWNLQEVFARRGVLPAVHRPVWYAARIFTIAFAVGLLVCAWPGWLQGPPFEPRRWAVEQPVGLQAGAEFLRRGHTSGLWAPESRTLHVSPDTLSAFKWFCPEDRSHHDPGAHAGLPIADDLEDRQRQRGRLREIGVNRVVVDASEPGSLALLERLLADPFEWPLLHLRGGLVVFGWRDPARAGEADPFQGWEVDFERLAFRPDETETAPAGRPGPPGGRRWWEAFWKPAPPRAPGRDEATVLLMKAESLRRAAPIRHLRDWEVGQAAGLVAAAGGWVGPAGVADAALRLTFFRPPPPLVGPDGALHPSPITRLAFELFRGFMFDRGDTPVGVAYAAIRAARRAVADDPTDANSYLALGQAYVRIGMTTVEGKWGTQFRQLVRIRDTQASAAFNRAVALNPKLADAHFELVHLYQKLGCNDLAVEHLRAYRRLIQLPEGDRRAEAIDAELTRLSEFVDRQAREFAKEAERASVSDRAQMAVRRGLGGKARDLLLGSDVAAFGAQGTELEIQLLLRTGRPDDVLDWTTADVRRSLDDFSAQWYRTLALAAVGEYEAAHAELAALIGPDGQLPPASQVGEEVAGLIGKVLLDEQPGRGSVPQVVSRALSRADFETRLADISDGLARRCDALVLRGLLALEAGQIDRAREAFRAALTFSPTRAGGGQLEFNGRSVARDCLELIDRGGDFGRTPPDRP